jgi:solute carrier family 6 (neurotransmitter transporter, glycine) member 5/9
LFASFSSELPWVKCLASWGDNCVDSSSTSRIARAFSTKSVNQSISSSELYFLREVLKEKEDISTGLGSPDVKLTLFLFLGWAIVFIIIAKGIKSSGKVSYFLAVFPYMVMVTILVRGVTLDGSIDGILFFLKPKWGDILSPKVWYAAATQVFYSLSIGTGAIPMFASYNRFNHNIRR